MQSLNRMLLFSFRKNMDFSGREVIALFFFCVSFEFTQCSPIKYQLRCTPSSVYSTHRKHKKILKLFNTVINVFGSWPFLLNTTQGSSLDLTPDPITDANISIHTTHVRHTAHRYRQTRRHTSNNEKKGCKLQYKAMWCIWCIFFLACFTLFFVSPLIYGTF